MRISLSVILHLPVVLRKINLFFFLAALFPEHLPTGHYFLPGRSCFQSCCNTNGRSTTVSLSIATFQVFLLNKRSPLCFIFLILPCHFKTEIFLNTVTENSGERIFIFLKLFSPAFPVLHEDGQDRYAGEGSPKTIPLLLPLKDSNLLICLGRDPVEWSNDFL